MTRRSWWPLILIAVGLILLLDNLGFDVSLGKFWPVLLIILGFSLLFPRSRSYGGKTAPVPPASGVAQATAPSHATVPSQAPPATGQDLGPRPAPATTGPAAPGGQEPKDPKEGEG